MQKIPLTLAQPGMKLAKAITKANGMAIVGSGVELTEALIDRLDGMGIDKIFVVGDAVSASQNPSERALRLDHLFRRLGDDAYMVKVKAHLREYFTIKAAADAAVAAQGKD
jgi:UDP-N-acetylmuramyl pentapeptide synthase